MLSLDENVALDLIVRISKCMMRNVQADIFEDSWKFTHCYWC